MLIDGKFKFRKKSTLGLGIYILGSDAGIHRLNNM